MAHRNRWFTYKKWWIFPWRTVSHNQRVCINNQFRHGRPGYLVDHTWDIFAMLLNDSGGSRLWRLQFRSHGPTLAQGPFDIWATFRTVLERRPVVFRMLHRVHFIFIPVYPGYMIRHLGIECGGAKIAICRSLILCPSYFPRSPGISISHGRQGGIPAIRKKNQPIFSSSTVGYTLLGIYVQSN